MRGRSAFFPPVCLSFILSSFSFLSRTHTYVHIPFFSLLRISISTCLYNILSCVSIAQAHRGPAVVQVQISTQTSSKFSLCTETPQASLVFTFFFSLSVSYRMRSDFRRISSTLVNVDTTRVQTFQQPCFAVQQRAEQSFLAFVNYQLDVVVVRSCQLRLCSRQKLSFQHPQRQLRHTECVVFFFSVLRFIRIFFTCKIRHISRYIFLYLTFEVRPRKTNYFVH